MDRQFVVAHYDEDLSIWKDRQNVLVYTKGDAGSFENAINLPNVGREPHTYFHHIINNYDELSDVTIFSQARVSDCNCPGDFFEIVDNIRPPYRFFYEINRVDGVPMFSTCKGRPCHNEFNFLLDIEFVFEELFVVSCPHFFFSSGCSLIAVSKKCILRLPKSWYEKCLKLSLRKTGPWEFERLWPNIFKRKISDYRI